MSPVASAGTIKSAIVRSVFVYFSTRASWLSVGCFQAGKFPGVARSVCWSIWTRRLHFLIHHFHKASCQNANAWLWLSMIQVGTFASRKKTKCLSHLPAVIFPFSSHSITVSVPIWTSSRVHSIRLGTTIVWFVRSSQFRRLLEMGVVMMRGEIYIPIEALLYLSNKWNSQSSCSVYSNCSKSKFTCTNIKCTSTNGFCHTRCDTLTIHNYLSQSPTFTSRISLFIETIFTFSFYTCTIFWFIK